MGVLRKTRGVEKLLKEFKRESNAISAKELTRRFHGKLNKTTVYRLLDKLEDDGILHSFHGSKGIKWYAKYGGCVKSDHSGVHPHFECLVCGAVDCLEIEIRLPQISKRKVISSQFLIQGTCDSCLH